MKTVTPGTKQNKARQRRTTTNNDCRTTPKRKAKQQKANQGKGKRRKAKQSIVPRDRQVIRRWESLIVPARPWESVRESPSRSRNRTRLRSLVTCVRSSLCSRSVDVITESLPDAHGGTLCDSLLCCRSISHYFCRPSSSIFANVAQRFYGFCICFGLGCK